MLGDKYTVRNGSAGAPPGEDGISPVRSNSSAGEASAEQPTINIAEYWRLGVKHRFLIIGALLAALVIGTAITLLMTPTYTATMTLQIDREAARVLNVDDVSPRESMVQGEEFFQTQYGVLRSRTLAERVVDTLGLASSDAFLDQMGANAPSGGETAAERTRLRREAVLGVVQKNLGISPVRGSRLVVISFASPDPQLSARVTNAFGDAFIQSNLDRKFESSVYAREFLEDLIAQTKVKLEDAERELVQYATNEQIINVAGPEGGAGESQSLTNSNLVALNSALAEARAGRIAAEEKWRQTSGAALMNLPEVFENPAIQRLSEEEARLNAEYEQKLQIYQPEFPEMVQLRARITEIRSQKTAIANSIKSSIQGRYAVAANQEQALQNQVEGLKGDVLDLRSRSVQYNILQRELDTSRTLYEGLLQRYKEVSVTGGVATNNVSIIDRADPPLRPSGPRLLLNLAIAALLGLGLGVIASFIIEALDETLATPEDVEAKLHLPVLGAIPALDKGEMPLQALSDIRSGFSEAYYSLRTALQFSTPNGAPRTLLITSSRPAEGKSTTAYAIALSLARVGKRVLLIDGDLRNPSMHRVVGVDNDKGMSNLLSGDGDLESMVRPTAQEKLWFIPCGPLPPNPGELWGSDRLGRVLEDATDRYDHVVFDGPPVLGFADAPLLAAAMAGTLFILESRGTRRAQARGALRRLLMGRGHVLGVVLTKFNTKNAQYGGYDYAYDYSYGGGAPAKSGRK